MLAGTPSLLTPQDFASYRHKQLVRQQLRRTIRYPAHAKLQSGSVRLYLTISRDGKVWTAACQDATAPLFEEAAMDGIQAAGQFPPMPDELPDTSVLYEFLVAFVPGGETTISLDG